MREDFGCLKFNTKEFFPDSRGYFTEVYSTDRFANLEFPPIAQINVSKSAANTIRGMHFNTKYPQAKMLRVLQGDIIDVVIDLRLGSPAYGQVELYRLNAAESCFLIPAGYAHGFWAQTETILMYGCSRYYDPENDTGISLLDPQFDFPWRGIFDKTRYITSSKDLDWPEFDLAKPVFYYSPNDRFGCETLTKGIVS